MVIPLLPTQLELSIVSGPLKCSILERLGRKLAGSQELVRRADINEDAERALGSGAGREEVGRVVRQPLGGRR